LKEVKQAARFPQAMPVGFVALSLLRVIDKSGRVTMFDGVGDAQQRLSLT
jgi:hypothetical protein